MLTLSQPSTSRKRVLRYANVTTCIGLLSAAFSSTHAQCYLDPTTGRQICPINRGGDNSQAYPPTSNPLASIGSSAHCRIQVGDGTTGSGTLILKSDSKAIVLTCSHLFDSSTQQIIVIFPSGEKFAATLLDRDRAHDLAAVAIRVPDCSALEIETAEASGTLTACGYGQNGQFRATSGRVVGRATPVGAKYPSLTMSGAVRPGDSGGAVLNAAGRLVGVVWGERDGCTYATCGRPVREFVSRICGGQQPTIVTKPQLPPHTQPASQPQSPAMDWNVWSREVDSRLAATTARIATIDAKKQDRGDFIQRGELANYVRTEALPQIDTTQLAKQSEVESNFKAIRTRFENIHSRIETVHDRAEELATTSGGFFQGISAAKLLVGTLGLSGPVAIAVVIAGGLVGRRAANRIRGASTPAHSATRTQTAEPIYTPVVVDSPIPQQRTVPETHYVPIEKDSFAKAHQWASEHVARKYPGATEVLQAQDSLIKQFIAGGT